MSLLPLLRTPYPPPFLFQAGLIAEASSLLEQAEAGAKRHLKNSKVLKQTGRFPASTEWELIYSDCVILLGLTQALRYALCGTFAVQQFFMKRLLLTFMIASLTWAIYSVCECFVSDSLSCD